MAFWNNDEARSLPHTHIRKAEKNRRGAEDWQDHGTVTVESQKALFEEHRAHGAEGTWHDFYCDECDRGWITGRK